MFESKSGIFFIAGIGFFLLAFLGNGVVPMLMYKDRHEQTAEEVVNKKVLNQFADLAERYPDQFRAAFGEVSAEKCAEALRLGRQLYVGEGCWHCHSQFVRPVSNESRRYGPVSKSAGAVRHPPGRPRPVTRGRPPRKRLARRPLLPAADGVEQLADAGVSLVFRRLPRQAESPRPGGDHLRAVAWLVAR
jgi:hypothetical protein